MERLIKDFNQNFHEYPLKVVSVSDFFSNMNELLWGKVSKESLINDQSEQNNNKTKLKNFESMQRNERSEEIIVFFVDTVIYREQFENSKIKIAKFQIVKMLRVQNFQQ